MKREMQSQMAFQNKMRALKQQELNKCSRSASDEATRQQQQQQRKEHHDDEHKEQQQQQQQQQADQQGAGEEGRQHVANRGLSIGAAEEFWSCDITDDQLFEFLMSDG